MTLLPGPQLAGLQPTRCRCCHRTLTDPASRRAGIGPECAARLQPGPPARPRTTWPPAPADPQLPIPPTQPPLPYQETTTDAVREGEDQAIGVAIPGAPGACSTCHHGRIWHRMARWACEAGCDCRAFARPPAAQPALAAR